jgi:hypothetical protein
MEQSEEELCEISGEIQVGKARGQKIAKSLKVLKDHALISRAHETVREANKAAYKWQGKVRRL